LLLAVLVPVLMTAIVIAWNTAAEFAEGEKFEVARLESNLNDAARHRLKNIVEMARSAIEPVYNDASLPEDEAKTRVRDILRSFSFDNGNYVFAWTHDSFNLA